MEAVCHEYWTATQRLHQTTLPVTAVNSRAIEAFLAKACSLHAPMGKADLRARECEQTKSSPVTAGNSTELTRVRECERLSVSRIVTRATATELTRPCEWEQATLPLRPSKRDGTYARVRVGTRPHSDNNYFLLHSFCKVS